MRIEEKDDWGVSSNQRVEMSEYDPVSCMLF